MAARLLLLSRLEALNVVLVPACATVVIVSLGGRVGPWSTVGLLTCAVVLAEGAVYWWACYDHLILGDPALRDRVIPLLARAQPVNVVVLAVSASVLTARALGDVAAGGRSSPDLLVGLGWVGVAVLEHVNYFHVQLMHDTASDLRRLRRSRRLPRAHLARDLRRHRRRSRAAGGRSGG